MNNLGLLAAREGPTGEAVGYFPEAPQAEPRIIDTLDNLAARIAAKGAGMRLEKRIARAGSEFQRC